MLMATLLARTLTTQSLNYNLSVQLNRTSWSIKIDRNAGFQIVVKVFLMNIDRGIYLQFQKSM